MDWIIIVLVSAIVFGFIFGFITKAISNSRGMKGGYWWGFFLGVIGIIVVACRPNEEKKVGHSYNETRKKTLEKLFLDGKITGEEYKKALYSMQNGGNHE